MFVLARRGVSFALVTLGLTGAAALASAVMACGWQAGPLAASAASGSGSRGGAGASPSTLVSVRGQIGGFAQDGDRIAWLWPTAPHCRDFVQSRDLRTGVQVRLAARRVSLVLGAWEGRGWLARWKRAPRPSRKVVAAVIGALALLMLLPVRLSALAPAEVTPLKPASIAAPVERVLGRFHRDVDGRARRDPPAGGPRRGAQAIDLHGTANLRHIDGGGDRAL